MGKNIAFVPLRGGSKSIVLKNIRTFLGKPLTYWVLKSLEYAKSIDVIVVAVQYDDACAPGYYSFEGTIQQISF